MRLENSWEYELRNQANERNRKTTTSISQIKSKKDLQKIVAIFAELQKHPTTGTGQIEALKGNLSGY